MRPDVVAIQRRERVVLAAVVSETRAADGSGVLVVVAEDGAKFPFPAAQALARGGDVPEQAAGEGVPAWLSRVRAAVARPVDWRALHALTAAGAATDAGSLAALVGLAGDAGRLAIGLACVGAEPWFRRDGGKLVAVPREQAEAKLARAEAAQRAHAEDAALLAWWPNRAASPAPAEARGAVDAIAAFGLAGQTAETERGRLIAAKLDVPEADQVIEALVACGALPADTDPSPQRAGLAGGFSGKARAEAERIAAAPVDAAGREDLTHLEAIAVDDADTTEVDDAVSIRETAEGTEVLVHISDAAAAIPPDSPLDRAAAARGSSLYTPERSIAMLPVAVVPRLSLEAGIAREAVTGIFRIDGEGRVAASRFVRSLVRVTRRMTYDATVGDPALAGLVAVAERLRAARREAGAILVSLESLKVTVAGGVPHLALRHQTTPGDLVVAELMVLYNREAARVLAKADAPAFFRTQGEPREGEPAPDDPLFPVRVRRRFAPSSVSVEPGRHCGVGAAEYLQATSPIRRYADLVNQRQLAAVAAGGKPPHNHADLERAVAHVVERERAVRTAADDRTDYWVARSVEPRAGATIDGVLSRAPRRGMGSVWVPSLCRELPLRPPAAWTAPPEGTRAAWRIARVAPWRGRIELEP